MTPSSFQSSQIKTPLCFLRASFYSCLSNNHPLLPIKLVLYIHTNISLFFLLLAYHHGEIYCFLPRLLQTRLSLQLWSFLLLCWQVNFMLTSFWGLPVFYWIRCQPLSMLSQVRPKKITPIYILVLLLYFPDTVEYFHECAFLLWFTFFSQCQATSLQLTEIAPQMLLPSWNLLNFFWQNGWKSAFLKAPY